MLEQLAPGLPCPKSSCKTRSLAKLKSTYTDKLPEMISPKDGPRAYHLRQPSPLPGRLASNNPNLQNIPIRTAEGRRVTRAFTAPRRVIVSADYSQIELRIMAHLSSDKTLINAFKTAETYTAAQPPKYSAPPRNVSSEQRRYAPKPSASGLHLRRWGPNTAFAKSLASTSISAKNFLSTASLPATPASLNTCSAPKNKPPQ